MKRMIGFPLLLVVLLLGAVVVAPSMSVKAEVGPTPDPPINLEIVNVSQTGVTLTWENTTTFSDVNLDLWFKPESEPDWPIPVSLPPTSTSYQFTGLECGTIYQIFLWVWRMDGPDEYSSQSEHIQFGTLSCSNQLPPPAPQNFHQTAATQTTISVEWDPVVGVAGYVVYQEFSSDNWFELEIPAQYTNAYLQGFKCGNSYNMYVRAYVGSGAERIFSDSSNQIAAVTTGCEVVPLNPPVILPEETVMQRNSLQVHWIDTNNNPNEDRHVVWYRDLDTEDYLSVEVAANVTVATLPDLQCNTGYSLSVYAYQGNDHFNSEWITATTSGCVNPPGNIGAIDVGADFIEIGWVDANDDPFNEDRHVIWYREIGTEEYFSVEFEPNSESGMITGLKPDTEYSVSVFAYIGEERASSDWITVKTEKCQLFLPVIRT